MFQETSGSRWTEAYPELPVEKYWFADCYQTNLPALSFRRGNSIFNSSSFARPAFLAPTDEAWSIVIICRKF